jgi:hypothetical protein
MALWSLRRHPRVEATRRNREGIKVLKSVEARRTWVPPDLRPIEAEGLHGVEPRTFGCC